MIFDPLLLLFDERQQISQKLPEWVVLHLTEGILDDAAIWLLPLNFLKDLRANEGNVVP